MSQHVNLSASGPPETVLDPEPADAPSDWPRPRRSTARPAGRPCPSVVADHPRCLRPGPAWASWPETTSRPTPPSASATTAGSIDCGPTAGGARATSAGTTPRTRASSGRSPASAGIADAIGEDDEAERCAQFLAQLDPSASRPQLTQCGLRCPIRSNAHDPAAATSTHPPGRGARCSPERWRPRPAPTATGSTPGEVLSDGTTTSVLDGADGGTDGSTPASAPAPNDGRGGPDTSGPDGAPPAPVPTNNAPGTPSAPATVVTSLLRSRMGWAPTPRSTSARPNRPASSSTCAARPAPSPGRPRSSTCGPCWPT